MNKSRRTNWRLLEDALKQIAVVARAQQIQQQQIIIVLIDKQPIRLDVAFTDTKIVSGIGQGMVAILGRKDFIVREHGYHFL
jgi:hypothetical protein